jgi:AraC family transcriptional regulator of adaptative response / DNA-3-methyladenine glycosylase II
MLSPLICQQARLSRDRRFDGLFYLGVKSTGIYCRPICPARLPAELQVSYYPTAASAAAAGFRPCLRCRPDSAPGSPAWLGSETSLRRALQLIAQGALIEGDQAQLASRLGISERYLRKLFQQHLGVSPLQYALYQQVLLAKFLLHQTNLTITAIAFQAGFHSIRRFNAAFLQQLQLSPSQIRRRRTTGVSSMLTLELSYRPPLNWPLLIAFWQQRCLDGMEWVHTNAGQYSYGRTFCWPLQPQDPATARSGWFEVSPKQESDSLQLQLYWPYPDGLSQVLAQIRRLLDLDADLLTIEQHLTPLFGNQLTSGIRIPGLWSSWEAAVRAVLGQQVSIAGARSQLNRLVTALGTAMPDTEPQLRLFPTPQQVLASDLQMLKVPQARRETLQALAIAVLANPAADPTDWLAIKGIGPWTVAYSKMRGLADPDIWLAGDLGVQKALKLQSAEFAPAQLAPWRSYATLQLWFSLPPKPRKIAKAAQQKVTSQPGESTR